MNPDEQNQTTDPAIAPVHDPEQVKKVVQQYSQYKDTTRSKKFLFVTIILIFGMLLFALVAILAYTSDGSRTEDNIEQLENEVIPQGTNVDI